MGDAAQEAASNGYCQEDLEHCPHDDPQPPCRETTATLDGTQQAYACVGPKQPPSNEASLSNRLHDLLVERRVRAVAVEHLLVSTQARRGIHPGRRLSRRRKVSTPMPLEHLIFGFGVRLPCNLRWYRFISAGRHFLRLCSS